MRSAGTPDVKQCLTEHGLGELIRRGLALDLWCSHWMFIPVIPGVLSVWAVLGISLSLTFAGSECAGGSSTERFPPEFPRGFGVCAANDFQGNPRLIQLLITLRQKVGSPSGVFPSGGGRVGSYLMLFMIKRLPIWLPICSGHWRKQHNFEASELHGLAITCDLPWLARWLCWSSSTCYCGVICRALSFSTGLKVQQVQPISSKFTKCVAEALFEAWDECVQELGAPLVYLGLDMSWLLTLLGTLKHLDSHCGIFASSMCWDTDGMAGCINYWLLKVQQSVRTALQSQLIPQSFWCSTFRGWCQGQSISRYFTAICSQFCTLSYSFRFWRLWSKPQRAWSW